MVILAQQNPTYQPAMRIVQDITVANPAVITTTFAHNYLDGDIVQIIINAGGGMPQMNKQQGRVTVISPTSFSIPVDSRKFDPFVFPADINLNPLNSSANKFFTPSQVVPVGNINSSIYLASQNVLRNSRP